MQKYAMLTGAAPVDSAAGKGFDGDVDYAGALRACLRWWAA
jgi:hypothetical protein